MSRVRGFGPRHTASPVLPRLGIREGGGVFSRRSVLRGLVRGGLVSVGLPWLEIFAARQARACTDGFPIRFGLFCWANGNVPDYWLPTGEGYDWELSETLSPLAEVKPWLTVVSGLSVKVENAVPHTSGAAGLLTGMPPEAVGSDYTFGGPTIDQIIAASIGGDAIYPSVQTAASNASGQSYNGPSSRNPPEIDPYTFYARMFGDTFREPGDEGLVDPSLGLRRSALDAVMEDIAALQAKVGAEDRVRLEQHLDGIRALETRLARLEEDPPDLDACERPAEPLTSYPDVEGVTQVKERSRAMMDLVTMALACDQTRVFAHYLADPVSDVLYPGASAGHHSLTHDEADPQPEVRDITLQCITEYAYLLQSLAKVQEGDSTLLDHCVVMGCTEVSHGRTHSLDDMPIVLAGGACGALKTGYHYRSYSQTNASECVLSVMRAVGISAESFGVDDALATDGLSEIEA